MRNEQAETYSQIGKGQESEKYQCTLVHKGRIKNTIEFIAIKTIDCARDGEVANYEKIARLVDHNNIVRFRLCGKTSHHYQLWLEYCPGGTLLELLERDTRLPEPIIRIFGGDILAGLFHLHQRGIVYRDLQPRNIIIDQCGFLKLNDLSHAELLEEPFDLGVPDPLLIPYMAPELFHEQGVASFASDHWALGCLLYQLASGVTPFAGAQDEMVDRIHNVQPPGLAMCSKEFNDLVHDLLTWDCFKRIGWAEIVAHPWWRNSLSKRPDRTFEDFSVATLPAQPRFKKNEVYVGMTKRVSTITLPRSQRDGSLQTSRKGETSLSALIVSYDQMTAPLIFNSRIESLTLPSYDLAQIPPDVAEMASNDSAKHEKAMAAALAFLGSPKQKSRAKVPLISFLIKESESTDCANALANSNFLKDLLALAKESRHPSLTSGFLLLAASIVRHAKNIRAECLSESTLAPIEEITKENEKSARRAVMVLGEVAYYIVRWTTARLPGFAGPILLANLQNKDEITRHYALRAISNILSTERGRELFDLRKIEEAVIPLGAACKGHFLDSYATCLVMIYRHIQPSDSPPIEELLHRLLGQDSKSATTKTIAIILASVTNFLPKVKNELQTIINESNGELGVKALLAGCLVFSEDLDGFAEISPRFYMLFEKVEKDADEGAGAIAKAVASICTKILLLVKERCNYALVSVITKALTIPRFRTEIWTKSFATTFRDVLKAADFDHPHAENLIPLVESAVNSGTCDILIVADCLGAIEAKDPETRFSALHLIADLLGQPLPGRDRLVRSVMNAILPRLTALLGDPPPSMVPDVVLRLLSNATVVDSTIVRDLMAREKLQLLFARVVDNASATVLACRIVTEPGTMIGDLVETGLIKAIVEAMNSRAASASVSLLVTLLNPLWKQTAPRPSPQLLRAVEQIAPLAAVAAPLADCIEETPTAGTCLGYIICLFTQAGVAQVAAYAPCFERVAKVLNRMVDAPTCAEAFGGLLKTMCWAAQNNAEAKEAMRRGEGLAAALKKLQANGPEALKPDASTLIGLIADQSQGS
jgi:serine/threonine-protein kinase ULK4